MEPSTSSDTPPSIPAPAHPVVYRFWRGVIRLWFALTFRKIRVLNEERLNRADPALLMVSHPESFLDALILAAGFKRLVRCIIPAALVHGPLQALLARGLGMISFFPESRQAVLEGCSTLLAKKAALVTFVEPGSAHPPGRSGLATTAASIALEAESRLAGGLGLLIFPVYLFLPVGHTHSREVLIDVDRPEIAHDCVSLAGAGAGAQIAELAQPLGKRCQENSFRLQPADVSEFLGDLEQALRDAFQEELALQPAHKQKLEGFELSRFVVQWAEQMNYLHPGLLVSLRGSLQTWREARRLGALHRLEVEESGGWLNRRVSRGVVCLETVVGFVIAFYGLLNHLLAIALLYLTGLIKKEGGRDKTRLWLGRGLVVLGSYAAQVFLVARVGGRRAAGYYLPTLPLSALYLWRYVGLLRRQTRLTLLSFNLTAEAARTKRLREDFLHEINEALNHYAEMLALPH